MSHMHTTSNDLQNITRIHFIGAGGISMSGLMMLAQHMGLRVSGSDARASQATAGLAAHGIPVAIGHTADNIPADAQAVVYSLAVREDNPELVAARARGLVVSERAQYIVQMLRQYKRVVCVAGTHGKTSTTGLIAHIVQMAGLDPTVLLGGVFADSGKNYRAGSTDLLIMEACEYRAQFLHWKPDIGVILNIDHDHPDCYATPQDTCAAFAAFAQGIVPGGLVINHTARDMVPVRGVTFGDGGDFWAKDVQTHSGCGHFTLMHGSRAMGDVRLQQPGAHHVSNALAAAAVLSIIGADDAAICAGLENPPALQRRYQFLGHCRGAKIYDDYAHHPTEISSCLDGIKKAHPGPLICVFEPHTYSRTLGLLDDFARCFGSAARVVVLPIFAAREAFTDAVCAQTLADRISAQGTPAYAAESHECAAHMVREWLHTGATLVTIGAGEAYKVAELLK